VNASQRAVLIVLGVLVYVTIGGLMVRLHEAVWGPVPASDVVSAAELQGTRTVLVVAGWPLILPFTVGKMVSDATQ
jgi:hypothetical protein